MEGQGISFLFSPSFAVSVPAIAMSLHDHSCCRAASSPQSYLSGTFKILFASLAPLNPGVGVVSCACYSPGASLSLVGSFDLTHFSK